jgi:hypothetical protein
MNTGAISGKKEAAQSGSIRGAKAQKEVGVAIGRGETFKKFEKFEKK